MNNKFIKSTLILLIGGILTKLLSFIIRVYFTRVITEKGINIYSIVMPTYSLLITITQLGFPIAISNIIAKGEKKGKNVIFSVIPVSIILNIILILIVLFSANYLSINLLHNKDAYYPLISIAFVLPFISLSSIIRGYFFGKQQMMPHSVSNIIEQLFKLCVVLLILPKLLKYGTIIAVSGYILISILSETISIIIFLLYLPKGFTIKKEDIKPDIGTAKEVLRIGLPSVGSRIIGNIGYFLEPIVLTSLMLLNGYNTEYIQTEYAIYNTYVISVLVVPPYLLSILSTSLLPEITKHRNNKIKIKRILKKVFTISLLLGLISNILIYILAPTILKIVFHTTKGIKYIRFLSLFFTIYYFEAPLASTLQALNESKYVLKTTTIAIILKLLIMSILCFTKIGIYSLVISEIVDIFVVVYLNTKKVITLLQQKSA